MSRLDWSRRTWATIRWLALNSTSKKRREIKRRKANTLAAIGARVGLVVAQERVSGAIGINVE